MEAEDFDPLQFGLRGKVSQLVSAHPGFRFPDVITDSTSRATELLNSIARLLAFSALTDEVSIRFRPILMDLCSRWLDMDDIDERHVFESFAALVRPHREIFPCVLLDFFIVGTHAHQDIQYNDRILFTLKSYAWPTRIHLELCRNRAPCSTFAKAACSVSSLTLCRRVIPSKTWMATRAARSAHRHTSS
jgi:hypothetical protein